MGGLKHRASANGLLILFSVVCALMIAEVGFRLYLKARSHRAPSEALMESPLFLVEPQSRYGYRLKPNTHRENTIPGPPGRMWSYSVNAEGLRGEALRAPHPTRKRMLFIGDSYTFGWGVEDHQTYPEQVEALLRQSLVSLDVEALNLRVPGFNTLQEYELLNVQIDAYHPDLVVLGYVMNDANGLDLEAMFRGNPFYLWTALRYVLSQRLFALPRRHDESPAGPKPDYRNDFKPGSPHAIQSRTALEGIASLCRRRHIPLVVAILPDFTEPFDGSYPFTDIHNQVKSWCDELGIPVMDLLPPFAGTNHKAYWVEGNGHPNAEAYQIIAAHLSPLIRHHLLR